MNIDPELVGAIEAVEDYVGFELEITSGYREDDDGAHGRGKAVDISCIDGKKRWLIVNGLISEDVCRIGVYNRHIHADICEGPEWPEPVIWTGVSK